MPSLRSLLLLGLPFASVAVARHLPEVEELSKEDVPRWEQTLSSSAGDLLKAAIESDSRHDCRESVTEEDGHEAAAVVRSDDATTIAARLVDLARQDAAIVKNYLHKRQGTNSTTTELSLTTETITTQATTSPSSTSQATTPPDTTPDGGETTPTTAPTSETTQTGVLIPIEVSTTAEDGSVIVTTTNAFETTAPTSVAVELTTTNDDGATITTSTMAPAAIITATNSEGSVVTTTSPLANVAVAPGGSIVTSAAEMVTTTDAEGGTVVLSSPTPGGVYTTTDARGRVATVTYRPRGGTVSQLRLQTTTLSNGQRSTITSFEQVGAATDGSSGAGATGDASASGQPGLQSGAVARLGWYEATIAMLAGAAVGVAAVFM